MTSSAISCLNPDQHAALQRFADQHGRTWKSALLRLWSRGGDEKHADGALLRQVRNNLGRDWLYQNARKASPLMARMDSADGGAGIAF